MDGSSQDFAASRLSFEVAGDGVAVDPATGRLSIDTGRLGAGVAVVVTATNAAGDTVSRLRLTLASDAGTPPVVVAAPALAPVATVGTAVVLDPGTWGGVPAPSLAVAWLLDGVVVEGATDARYTPAVADEGKALAARVTATNAAGAAAAETAAVAVVHAAPTVVATLADVVADAGADPVTVDAAAAFAGADLTFAVAGPAVIDTATGVVTIAASNLIEGEPITVTATNSGGSAQTGFAASVRATPPLCATRPALAGPAVVGTPVTLDPGAWEGMPAPGLAIAWLLDGVVVPGATAATYVPQPADDSRALAARVTATNAAGSVEAVTAALAVVHAAPTVVAALADLGLFAGDAAAVVDAAAAFEGQALAFAVAGGGASVDAAGRVSVPATSAGSAMVTVTATNSGGSATVSFVATVSVRVVPPLLVLAPVLAGTGRIGEPVTVSAGNWSGVPAPATSVAWLRDGAAIAGAAGTRYTPVAADDGKGLSARVTATNAAGSAETVTAALAVTYAPPVAKGGLVEEIFDLGSGVQTVAAGADFTGENLRFAVSGAGATIDAQTGLVSIPTDKAVQATVTVTATNSGGSASSSFGVTVEAEDVPFALEADDVAIETSVWRPEAQETWFTPVVRLPGLDGETVDAIEWTTSKDPVSETQFEVATKVGTNRYQLYMRDSARNAPGATPRIDYSVFKLDEKTRRDALRFRWRRTAEGPWSGMSPAFSIPEAQSVTTTNTWYPFMGRTARQYADGLIGGDGRQNFKFIARSAADPNLVWWGLDVNGPVRSQNAGDWYSCPQLRGMAIQESCAGLWIDSSDPDWIVLGASGGDLRSTSTTPNAYDNYAGLYLSTDGGATATHTLQLTNVPSCGVKGERDNKQLIAAMPGGTTRTRTLFYAHKPRPKGGSWGTGRIYKSTDGGQTWVAFGASLTNVTFGEKIYWIDTAPNGNVYLGCDGGLFISADGCATWTQCSGIAGPVVIVNAYHGGTKIWAACKGNGAYKATSSAGTTFSRNSALGSYDIIALAVCPMDASRILVAESSAGSRGKWSHDGGSSWNVMVHRDYEGNTDNWSSFVCGEVAIFSWTPGSTTEVVVQCKQNFGKSVDGGASTFWSGDGTDYQTRRGIGFDADDWQFFVSGTQDTVAVCTTDGLRTETKHGLTRAQMTTVKDSGSYISGSGGLILKNGSHKAVLTAAGGQDSNRTPILWSTSGTDPLGSGTLLDSGNRSSCQFSGRDRVDASIGWMGKCRFKLSSDGSTTIDHGNMPQDFFGASSSELRIFGGDNSGTSKDLYVSDNGGNSWSLWGTSPIRYRNVTGSPLAVGVSRHSANRVYVGEAHGGTGRVYKMEGSSPSSVLVFTLADQPGFKAPETVVYRVVECPSDETIVYVLAFAAGNSLVFRINDVLTTPVVEDVTGNAPLRALAWLYVHDLTDDVILAGQTGSRIMRCQPRSKAPNAGALFDRTKAYVDANIAQGLSL